MRFFLILFLLTALPLAAEDSVTVTGKLAGAGKAAALKVKDKEVRLVSKDEIIQAILEDERLLGRELEAIGKWEVKDRRLEVQQLHTLRNGRRYRITYFCDLCNIWNNKPGPCDCCQQPVELREVPVEKQ